VSFAAITLCVASQLVFIIIVVYFVIDSVRKLVDIPSYIANTDKDCDLSQDGPVLLSAKMPHDKENRDCLDYIQKSGHESRRS